MEWNQIQLLFLIMLQTVTFCIFLIQTILACLNVHKIIKLLILLLQ